MKVLVGLDDSPHSAKVVDAIIRRSWPESTQFRLLAVVEPLTAGGKDCWPDAKEATRARRKKNAEELCQSARKKMQDHITYALIHYELREGDPRKQIIDAAAKWGADRIILGAHSKDVCPHFLLGSVSRAVSTHAPCSVEIVREKHKTMAKV